MIRESLNQSSGEYPRKTELLLLAFLLLWCYGRFLGALLRALPVRYRTKRIIAYYNGLADSLEERRAVVIARCEAEERIRQ